MALPEGGHCYMFKEEMPDCQQFISVDSKFTRTNPSININIAGSSGVRGRSLNVLSLLALASITPANVGDNQLAQTFPVNNNNPYVPFSNNKRREGKSKKPKKW